MNTNFHMGKVFEDLGYLNISELHLHFKSLLIKMFNSLILNNII